MNYTLDVKLLAGLGFKIKDKTIIEVLIKSKKTNSAIKFINTHNLSISVSTLNNWLSLKYSVPLDLILKLDSKIFRRSTSLILYSGRSSSHCHASIPLKMTKELSYILGTVIGDGSLKHKTRGSYELCFEMSSKAILSLIMNLFNKLFLVSKKLKLIKRKDGRRYYLLRYSNKIIYFFFNYFFNLHPRKSKNVSLDCICSLNKNEKLAFLLGLYHTDGSDQNGSVRFYTSSPYLKDDITKILLSLGYAPSIYTYKRKKYTPEYHVITRKSEKLLPELLKIERYLIRN